MKFFLLTFTIFLLVSCSSKDVQNVDDEAEKVRDRIKKDEGYCSPIDKVLNTEGCGG